jgi:hypothetical protein
MTLKEHVTYWLDEATSDQFRFMTKSKDGNTYQFVIKRPQPVDTKRQESAKVPTVETPFGRFPLSKDYQREAVKKGDVSTLVRDFQRAYESGYFDRHDLEVVFNVWCMRQTEGP